MTESKETPWRETTLGLIIFQAVLPAAASTLFLKYSPKLEGLSPAAVAAVCVGIAGLTWIVISVVNKKIRKSVWSKPFNFLVGLRVTSAKRRAAIEKAAAAKGFADGEEFAAIFGTSSSSEPQAIKPPPPDPRWQLVLDHVDGKTAHYTLKNRIPGSVVKNLRLDFELNHALSGAEFISEGFWSDFSGQKQDTFEIIHLDPSRELVLELTWLDHNLTGREDSFRCDSFDEDYF